MSEYVPVREVNKLAVRAESNAGVMPDESTSERLAEQMAADVRKIIDEHAVSKAEVADDD